MVEGDPKTQSSRRTLPMDAGMAGVLKSASARYAQERLALGAAHADSGYVACNEAGEPYTPGALTNMWHSFDGGGGCAPDPAARRPPFVRHGSAFAGSADGRDRQVARPRRPVDHREVSMPTRRMRRCVPPARRWGRLSRPAGSLCAHEFEESSDIVVTLRVSEGFSAQRP